MDEHVDPASDEFVDNEDFEKFKQQNLDYVESVFEGFDDPEDDLHPLAIFDCGEGLSLCPLGMFMENSESKDQLSDILAKITEQLKPTRYAFISSSWGVSSKEGDDLKDWYANNPGVSLQEHPDRIELIFVINADWSGKVCVLNAEIHRDGENPPTLAGWEVMNEFNWLDPGEIKAESRFLDPVMYEITGAKRRMIEGMKEAIPENMRDEIFAAISEIYPNGILPDPREMTEDEFNRVRQILLNHFDNEESLVKAINEVSEKMRTMG